MYLNEKAWQTCQNNKYLVKDAMVQLLNIYKTLGKRYNILSIYVYKDLEKTFSSKEYSFEKWFHDVDPDTRSLFRTMWEHRISFQQEEEMEFMFEDEPLYAGTEAILNDSCVISVGFHDKWKNPTLSGEMILLEGDNETAELLNLYTEKQIDDSCIREICLRESRNIQIYTYEELWLRKEKLFPHLMFCPSVKDDMKVLQKAYISQVINKLMELEEYCRNNTGKVFDAGKLSKTTPESEATMNMYKKEHTFKDENNTLHTVSWHMRFTGIPGRIFFELPDQNGRILICYIGKKLPNATYAK